MYNLCHSKLSYKIYRDLKKLFTKLMGQAHRTKVNWINLEKIRFN
jgi:hypothetical protein